MPFLTYLYHITYGVVFFNDGILFRSVEEKANCWGNECEMQPGMQRPRPLDIGLWRGYTWHQCSENKGFRRTRQDLNGSCLAPGWVLEVVIKVDVCSACLHDCRLHSVLFGLVNVTGDHALSYVCTHKADLMPLSLGWIILAVNHGHLVLWKLVLVFKHTDVCLTQKRDTYCNAFYAAGVIRAVNGSHSSHHCISASDGSCNWWWSSMVIMELKYSYCPLAT